MQKSYNVKMSTSSGTIRGVARHLRCTDPFPPPITANYTVKVYVEKFRQGYWQLPFTQRNANTWPYDHYRELIESIFNNTVTSSFIGSRQDRLTTHLLDGGHRTEAILRFLDDKFPITCPDTYEDKKYSQLSEENRAYFMDQSLSFKIYSELTLTQEEFLFFRINNSLPFTPGEVVNGYSTIPMCTLARELGDLYAPKLRELFVRAVEGKNLRSDSSNLMFMILRNFHHGKIVKGEKMTKNEELKKICEEIRDVEIDIDTLRYNIKSMFDIFKTKKIDRPYLLMILPTVQAIMMKYNIGMNPETDNESKISRFSDVLATFLFEIEKSNNPLNHKWQSLKRNPEDVNIKGVQNPSLPVNCNKRASIFTEWCQMNRQIFVN